MKIFTGDDTPKVLGELEQQDFKDIANHIRTLNRRRDLTLQSIELKPVLDKIELLVKKCNTQAIKSKGYIEYDKIIAIDKRLAHAINCTQEIERFNLNDTTCFFSDGLVKYLLKLVHKSGFVIIKHENR